MQIIVLEPLCKSWSEFYYPNKSNFIPCFLRFLIEGSKGAILHTGDFRAEPWFLESLTRNPLLQRYLSPQDQEHVPSDAKQPLTYPVSIALEAIYLDTASTLSKFQIVTKVKSTLKFTVSNYLQPFF